MRDFRGLEVWQRAHRLTLSLYRSTARFPREELYGPTSQIRRCSASIGANIAEDCGKLGDSEFHRFLQIASGSASELDYQILLAHDQGFLPESEYQKDCAELAPLRRQLTTLALKVAHDREQSKKPEPANGQRPMANRRIAKC